MPAGERWGKGAVALLAIGLAQMAFDVAGLAVPKALAAATLLSPAPRVFSSVRGLETYSTRFFLAWQDSAGETRELELTPEVYGRLHGPYNRRNVWGAALAYGPVMATDEVARPMLASVTAYGLRGDAPVLRELGVDPLEVIGPLRLRYEPVQGTDLGELPRVLEIPLE